MSHGHGHGRGHSHAHGHGHAHGHARAGAGGGRGRLAVALGLTVVVLVVQVAGAAASGSLALLADAGHVLTDALGLVLALVAATLAARPATAERTFGWHRAEVLAAMANGLLLTAVATSVAVEGVRRLLQPQAVDGPVMLVVAVVGLAVNAAALGVLTGGDPSSLNLRGARLEVLGDLLGSAAVVVAAVVITTTGWRAADPVASVLVAGMVLPRVWWLLRDALDVLLEATPRHVDLAAVRAHARGVEGVVDVHDVHAWTITSGLPVLTAHVVVRDDVLAGGGGGAVLDQLQGCLAEHFDVEHSTFQVEPAGHRAHEASVHD